jgi:hypothetical protein
MQIILIEKNKFVKRRAGHSQKVLTTSTSIRHGYCGCVAKRKLFW